MRTAGEGRDLSEQTSNDSLQLQKARSLHFYPVSTWFSYIQDKVFAGVNCQVTQ